MRGKANIMTTTYQRTACWGLTIAALCLHTACVMDRAVPEPDRTARVALALDSDLLPEIKRLRVTVTGVDLDRDIVVFLDAADEQFVILDVPAEAQRTFIVEAFDTDMPSPDQRAIASGTRTIFVPAVPQFEVEIDLFQTPDGDPFANKAPVINAIVATPSQEGKFVIRDRIALEVFVIDEEIASIDWSVSAGTIEKTNDSGTRAEWLAPEFTGTYTVFVSVVDVGGVRVEGRLFVEIAEAPTTLAWSGRTWSIKSTTSGLPNQPVAPGPNFYSNAPDAVRVSDDGYLRLALTQRSIDVDDGQEVVWHGAEISSEETFGYGRYRFVVEGGLPALDPQAVFGAFIFSQTGQLVSEIDIEFTDTFRSAGGTNGHFTVQRNPFAATDNAFDFVHDTNSVVSLAFTWAEGRVEFEVYEGDHELRADSPRTIAHWIYQPDENDVPTPTGREKVHLNHWLSGGMTPQNPATSNLEVVVRKFTFTSGSPPPPPLFQDSFDPGFLDLATTKWSFSAGIVHPTNGQIKDDTGHLRASSVNQSPGDQALIFAKDPLSRPENATHTYRATITRVVGIQKQDDDISYVEGLLAVTSNGLPFFSDHAAYVITRYDLDREKVRVELYTKSDLANCLPHIGNAVCDRSDPLYRGEADLAPAEVVTNGDGAVDIQLPPTTIELALDGTRYEVRVRNRFGNELPLQHIAPSLSNSANGVHGLADTFTEQQFSLGAQNFACADGGPCGFLYYDEARIFEEAPLATE